MVEARARLNRIVHVVAALHAHRNFVAERRVSDIGPRPQRQDGVAGHQRAVFGFDAVARRGHAEAARVAFQKMAAQLLEQRHIGESQCMRVDDRGRVEIMDGGQNAIEIRLDGSQGRRIIDGIAQSERFDPLRRGQARRQTSLAAKQLEPAGPAQQILRARLFDQGFMLAQRSFDQGQRCARMARGAIGRALVKIPRQKGREARQVAQAVAGLIGAVDAITRQGPPVAGKQIGKHRGALDQPGVAETGLLARPAPVDQSDRPSPQLQVQSGANADNASAKNDDIGLGHGPIISRKAISPPVENDFDARLWTRAAPACNQR